MKPSVVLFLPPDVIRRMFRSVDMDRLNEFAIVSVPTESPDQLVVYPALDEAVVIITGWKTPRLSPEVLDTAPNLKLLAHSAGSVKGIAGGFYRRGIRVTTAADANAVPVADFTITMMMSLLKQVPWIGPAFSRGDHEEVDRRKPHLRELADMEVGIVSASRIGRLVIQRLKTYPNITIKLYDPFVTDAVAAELGAVKASLTQVCRCEVISVHAPNLAETRHLISAQMIAEMPDHAVFINTSRGELVDEIALVAELYKRPLYAALDVTDPEPPLPNSLILSAPNLLLTPHIAGAQRQACLEMGKLAIDETIRFLTGQPLQFEVTREMFATQA